MKLVYKYSLAIVLSLLSIVVFAAPAKQVFTKNIKKEFSVSANGTCEISNRYGIVELKTWDKNKVKVDVLISIKADTEASANNSMENIVIYFDNSADFVSARTEIKEKMSKWNSNKNLSIDYLVYIPESLNLKLTNKYGNVSIPNCTGSVSLNLKHGDASVSSIEGDFDLVLAHGNLISKQINTMSGSVSYSDVSVAKINNLRLNSKYSEYTLPVVGKLILNSKYDEFIVGQADLLDSEAKYTEFKIGKCEELLIEAEFTDLDIDLLKDAARFNMKYGEANIASLARGFGNISLAGKYTDFNLNVEEGSNYQLTAVCDYAGIDYPSNLRVTYEVEKSSFHELEGYIGIQGSRSKIQAVLNYGGLEINE